MQVSGGIPERRKVADRRTHGDVAVATPRPPAPTRAKPLRMLPAAPLATAAAIRAPVAPLIGREELVARATQTLLSSRIRLLTLTGPGGVGKTHLALVLIGDVAGLFSDGVYWIDLAAVTDPAAFVPTLARALGFHVDAAGAVFPRLKQALAGRRLLLGLDNFEQLLAAAAELAELVVACPQLTVVVTSRAPLRIRGEQVLYVPPLAVPPAETSTDLSMLAAAPAVALFLDRVQSARPDFALTHANAHAVGEVCRRLDGLPLAIELAAANCDVLSPQLLLERLAQPRALEDGPVDLPERQRTLATTLDWSYALLTPAERTLLRALAVFVGGVPLEAVARVAEMGAAETYDAVRALARHSLARLETASESAEPRVYLLETIRVYALARLVASDEARAARERHAAYYCALAEEAAPVMMGPDGPRWIARLAGDHDNLRAALRWALDVRDSGLALRLAGALWWFWYTRGFLAEGREWLRAALALPDGDAWPAARANALLGAGVLGYHREGTPAELAETAALCVASLALYRQQDGRQGAHLALNALANARLWQAGGHEEAIALYEESVTLARELDDGHALPLSLHNLAGAVQRHGDSARAATLYQESLALFRAQDNDKGAAHALYHLAELAFARAAYTEGTALARESLALFSALGDAWPVARGLELLAALDAVTNQPERAARLLGAAGTARARAGAPLPAWEHAGHARLVATLREQLGEERYTAAWAAGEALALERAVAEALEVTGAVSADQVAETACAPAAGPLTRREREILELIARGQTSRQIGARLRIATRTVETHVNNLLAKLGVASRAEAAAWAARELAPHGGAHPASRRP